MIDCKVNCCKFIEVWMKILLFFCVGLVNFVVYYKILVIVCFVLFYLWMIGVFNCWYKII